MVTRLLALLGPVVVFAQQAGQAGSDVGWERLLNYGVLGIFTVLLATGRLESPKRADRAELALTAERQAKSDLEAVFRSDVVPAMTRFTDVAARILDRREP